MEMKTNRRRVEYSHCIEYDGKTYNREEVMVPECFAWEDEPDKLIDLHTISWKEKGSEWNKEYYSCDMGWSGDDGHMKNDNPMPKLEVEFKKTIGKGLFYFEGVMNTYLNP